MSEPLTYRQKDALSYWDRRKWQDRARARGEVPECGRASCTRPADPPYLNRGSPLIYCSWCAAEINRFTPGLCYPEPRSERE